MAWHLEVQHRHGRRNKYAKFLQIHIKIVIWGYLWTNLASLSQSYLDYRHNITRTEHDYTLVLPKNASKDFFLIILFWNYQLQVV